MKGIEVNVIACFFLLIVMARPVLAVDQLSDNLVFDLLEHFTGVTFIKQKGNPKRKRLQGDGSDALIEEGDLVEKARSQLKEALKEKIELFFAKCKEHNVFLGYSSDLRLCVDVVYQNSYAGYDERALVLQAVGEGKTRPGLSVLLPNNFKECISSGLVRKFFLIFNIMIVLSLNFY